MYTRESGKQQTIKKDSFKNVPYQHTTPLNKQNTRNGNLIMQNVKTIKEATFKENYTCKWTNKKKTLPMETWGPDFIYEVYKKLFIIIMLLGIFSFDFLFSFFWFLSF